VQDIQRRLAAPCRNVSVSTDLLDGNAMNKALVLRFAMVYGSTG